MAIWYTDVAALQQQYVNFPGQVGAPFLTTIPGSQNNSLFEGPLFITATYTITGNEAPNDIINIAKLEAGVLVDPNGHVSTGLTAPGTALSMAIGDNDLGLATNLPIPNAAAFIAQPTGYQAPNWVSGTTYAVGNVVLDPNSTPANQAYTCVSATSGTTAPHSAATTVWMPNSQRYSNSIVTNTAAANVAFAGGTQLYGGPASIVPFSTTPGTAASGYPSITGGPANATLWAANQPYQIQNDCWLQALLITANVLTANTVLVFRVPIVAPN